MGYKVNYSSKSFAYNTMFNETIDLFFAFKQ